jgi:hypothetical protein
MGPVYGTFSRENEVIPVLGLLWILSGPSCELWDLWDISTTQRCSRDKDLDPYKLVNGLSAVWFFYLNALSIILFYDEK